MRSKKVKIEVVLDDGSKITLTLNSLASRDKISKFLDLLELMEERLASEERAFAEDIVDKSSLMEKVTYLVYSRFLEKPFTLKDLMSSFVEIFGLELKKSTAATYLSRLVSQGILRKMGSRGSYKYVVIPPSRRFYHEELMELVSHKRHHKSADSS